MANYRLYGIILFLLTFTITSVIFTVLFITDQVNRDAYTKSNQCTAPISPVHYERTCERRVRNTANIKYYDCSYFVYDIYNSILNGNETEYIGALYIVDRQTFSEKFVCWYSADEVVVIVDPGFSWLYFWIMIAGWLLVVLVCVAVGIYWFGYLDKGVSAV